MCLDEMVFYKCIKEYCECIKIFLFGIGDFVCGVDFGVWEVVVGKDCSKYFYWIVFLEYWESVYLELGECSYMCLVLGIVGC